MDIVRALDVSKLEDFKTKSEQDEAMRAARAFLARIEPPFTRLINLIEGQPALAACLKVCKDIEFFERWDCDGEGPKTYDQLAKIANVPSSTLRRLLRHLATNFVISEVGPETYEQTSFSRSLKEASQNCWVQYFCDATGPTFLEMPGFLRRNGYEAPSDPRNGVFQDTFQCKGKTLFEWYGEHPTEAKNFNTCMTSYTGHRTRWIDVYPTERLIDGSTEGSLIVDVGGNVGEDLEAFRIKHPEHGSQLVLQDLPEVVSQATCSPEVVRMGHDFFTPQPVKGARAYYMHSIIHDWSDDHARKILRNIKDAMKPGYSKLLVNDNVISSLKPDPQMVMVDLTMMVKTAAGERTDTMFRDLLESVGLKVIKVWTAATAVTSIIEAELPVPMSNGF